MVRGGPGMDPKVSLFVRDEAEDENNHGTRSPSELRLVAFSPSSKLFLFSCRAIVV